MSLDRRLYRWFLFVITDTLVGNSVSGRLDKKFRIDIVLTKKAGQRNINHPFLIICT